MSSLVENVHASRYGEKTYTKSSRHFLCRYHIPLETKYDRSFEKNNLDGSREDSENAKS